MATDPSIPTYDGPKKKSTYRNGLLTPIGRVCFPNLASPDTVGAYARNKYKMTLILNPSEIAALEEACNSCAKEAFPSIPIERVNMPFRDGKSKASGKHPERFIGKVFITLTTKKQPVCIDMKKNAIDPAAVYAGCHARCIVAASSYETVDKVRDSATGKVETVPGYGITLLLDKVQFVKDDERWGGAGVSDFPNEDEEVARFTPPAPKAAPATEDCDI